MAIFATAQITRDRPAGVAALPWMTLWTSRQNRSNPPKPSINAAVAASTRRGLFSYDKRAKARPMRDRRARSLRLRSWRLRHSRHSL